MQQFKRPAQLWYWHAHGRCCICAYPGRQAWCAPDLIDRRDTAIATLDSHAFGQELVNCARSSHRRLTHDRSDVMRWEEGASTSTCSSTRVCKCVMRWEAGPVRRLAHKPGHTNLRSVLHGVYALDCKCSMPPACLQGA